MDFEVGAEQMMSETKEKHTCPICGSDKLESYKSDDKMYIKCDKCGHVLSEHSFRHYDIDYRSIFSILTGMTIFTVIFALAIRFFSSYMGFGP